VIPATLFGTVERVISPLDEEIGLLWSTVAAHPKTAGNPALRGKDMPGDQVAEFFGESKGAFAVDCCGEEGKFLTTPAGQSIRWPDIFADQLCQFPEDFVSCRVTEAVVDFLKPVNIKYNQCQRCAVSGGPRNFHGQLFVEISSVVYSGEGVPAALLLKGAMEVFQLKILFFPGLSMAVKDILQPFGKVIGNDEGNGDCQEEEQAEEEDIVFDLLPQVGLLLGDNRIEPVKIDASGNYPVPFGIELEKREFASLSGTVGFLVPVDDIGFTAIADTFQENFSKLCAMGVRVIVGNFLTNQIGTVAVDQHRREILSTLQIVNVIHKKVVIAFG
jgi:hypothetical protein